jgi:hypothetical protein
MIVNFHTRIEKMPGVFCTDCLVVASVAYRPSALPDWSEGKHSALALAGETASKA